MFRDVSTLLEDQEIKEIQKKYIEYGMEWLGYNCDEYKDIEDYKEKLKKNLDAFEKGEYKLPDDPEWRKKHEEMLAIVREAMNKRKQNNIDSTDFKKTFKGLFLVPENKAYI